MYGIQRLTASADVRAVLDAAASRRVRTVAERRGGTRESRYESASQEPRGRSTRERGGDYAFAARRKTSERIGLPRSATFA